MSDQDATPKRPTRNALLAELAAVAKEFLDAQELLPSRAGLPDLYSVQLEVNPSSIPEAAQISLHLASAGSLRGIAEWAHALGSRVCVVDAESYVACWTPTIARGRSVSVWTHITPLQAAEILEPAGLVLGKQVAEVDPLVALAVTDKPSSSDGA